MDDFLRESWEEAQQRAEVQYEVELGALTPSQAENWAAINNRQPFATPGKTAHELLNEALWPISYALLWISWRDADALSAGVAAHRFWRKHYWRNPIDSRQVVTLDAAKRDLILRLSASTVRSFGTAVIKFGGKDYQGARCQIEGHEWRSLYWTDETVEHGVFAEDEPRYADVFLLKDEILRTWPASGSESDQHKAVAKDKGGNPGKFDSKVFLIEAFKLIYEGSPSCASKDTLRKASLDIYFEKTGDLPSDSWAKPLISKIWTELGLDKN